MKPRRHRNSKARLTNAERVDAHLAWIQREPDGVLLRDERRRLMRMLQAACRATLARERSRRRRAGR